MNYEQALNEVLSQGTPKKDRTGVGTRSVTGLQIRYDLSEGFPLITSKKVHFKSVAEELFWFLRGETNTNTLKATIWDEWADENGDLGRIYGAQWRGWQERDVLGEFREPHDQIHTVQTSLYCDPFSRRHLVSAWNVAELDDMALPPCHYAHQYVAREVDGVTYVDLVVSQRSADMFLGVPFNLASYGLLLTLMCDVVGYIPGELIWNGADCHIYDNHLEQVKTQLEGYESEPIALPTLEVVGHHRYVWEYTLDDVSLQNYSPKMTLKGEVAV